MKIIIPYTELVAWTPDLEKVIELAGRTCYKSEDRMTPDSVDEFIGRILTPRNGIKHESVLEHGSISVRFVVDRGVSHELVQHRLSSFSQESTRYCNYGKDKFGNEITVIEPVGLTVQQRDNWVMAMQDAERFYFAMLKEGATPQMARSVLPNSLKTELIITANPRQWRLMFRLRAHRYAHPQMQEVMKPLLDQFAFRWPALFSDIKEGVA